MITEATIRTVKYSPELLPDSWFGNVPLNGEVAPVILDLKHFDKILRLGQMQMPPTANVNLRAKYDGVSIEQNTAAMLADLAGAPQKGAWNLPALSQLYFNFFGVAAVVGYSTHYHIWASIPTIADKIFWGVTLNPAEQAIATELGIADTVQKGLLPLPIDQQVEREYPVVGEETHTRSVTIAAGAVVYPIEVMYAKPNEILVLTKIAAAAGTAAQNIQIIVDRDTDANYVTMPTFPLSLTVGGEVDCFIPALTQIRLTTQASVAPSAELFRYTIKRIKLNNILRVRFGILPQAQAPADLWKKVLAGVV